MTDADIITLRSERGATARVHAHGAQVLSWHPAGGDDCLYLSPRSEFGRSSAIRGGIPVIFPQFGNEGPFPKHGFARNRRWQLCGDNNAGESSDSCAFRLCSDDSTHVIWPYEFEARLEVRLSDMDLHVTLEIANTDTEAFDFTAALHTYLAASNVQQATLHGLQGIQYLDYTRDRRLVTETSSAIAIIGEVDRIYLSAPKSLTLRSSSRQIRIDSYGFPDTVVWNPGNERCAALKDMPPDGYLNMLCVEAAVVGTPVRLQPGEHWSGSQTLQFLE